MGLQFLTKPTQNNNNNVNVLQELTSVQMESMPSYCQFSTQQNLVSETRTNAAHKAHQNLKPGYTLPKIKNKPTKCTN